MPSGVLKEIDVIVHPNEILRLYGSPRHPLQQWTRIKREQRWRMIAGSSTGAFRFSPLECSGIHDRSESVNLDREEDQLLSELFGSRLLRFGRTDLPSDEEIYGPLGLRGFYVDESVLLNIYGEILGGCPEFFGEHIAAILKIPAARIVYKPELSLDYDQKDLIRDWRKDRLEVFKQRMLR